MLHGMKAPGKIDFVLFDLGGVLCSVQPHLAEEAWERAGQGKGSIMELMHRSNAKPLGDVGELDIQGMARVLGEAMACSVSEALLTDVWGAMVSWRPFVPDLLERLTVPYGVLSTIDPIHSFALGPLPGAEPLVYSWDIGVTKPHPDAFLKAIDRCPVKPRRILYLDDLEENVTEARRCGLNAYCVTEEVDILRVLKESVKGF
jgi:HAD superfamily hydrolase (TIGR01509 family)